MANRKRACYKPGPLVEGKRSIIRRLLQEYNIENATNIQKALKHDDPADFRHADGYLRL